MLNITLVGVFGQIIALEYLHAIPTGEWVNLPVFPV